MQVESQRRSRGCRRKQIGLVISDKMQKTAIVEVKNLRLNKTVRKYIVQSKKYKVHSPLNEGHKGDLVEIVETRPLSRGKRWSITRVVRKRVGIEELVGEGTER